MSIAFLNGNIFVGNGETLEKPGMDVDCEDSGIRNNQEEVIR